MVPPERTITADGFELQFQVCIHIHAAGMHMRKHAVGRQAEWHSTHIESWPCCTCCWAIGQSVQNPPKPKLTTLPMDCNMPIPVPVQLPGPLPAGQPAGAPAPAAARTARSAAGTACFRRRRRQPRQRQRQQRPFEGAVPQLDDAHWRGPVRPDRRAVLPPPTLEHICGAQVFACAAGCLCEGALLHGLHRDAADIAQRAQQCVVQAMCCPSAPKALHCNATYANLCAAGLLQLQAVHAAGGQAHGPLARTVSLRG